VHDVRVSRPLPSGWRPLASRHQGDCLAVVTGSMSTVQASARGAGRNVDDACALVRESAGVRGSSATADFRRSRLRFHVRSGRPTARHTGEQRR
jgi:hypothetical protein